MAAHRDERPPPRGVGELPLVELRVAGRAPLTEAETAYARVATGGQRGRWLLEP